MLSNIKPASSFENQQENQGQNEQTEEDYQGEMNEVTICITKKGSEKTMVVHTVVTEGF